MQVLEQAWALVLEQVWAPVLEQVGRGCLFRSKRRRGINTGWNGIPIPVELTDACDVAD